MWFSYTLLYVLFTREDCRYNEGCTLCKCTLLFMWKYNKFIIVVDFPGPVSSYCRLFFLSNVVQTIVLLTLTSPQVRRWSRTRNAKCGNKRLNVRRTKKETYSLPGSKKEKSSKSNPLWKNTGNQERKQQVQRHKERDLNKEKYRTHINTRGMTKVT